MAGLLERDKTVSRDGTATEPVAASAPGASAGATGPAGPPCATCGASLAEGQSWCLECGSAQAGRLGARPGWRAALTVGAACAVLATGAGAAAYAALSTEPEPLAVAAAPPVAPAPAAPPPAAAPAAPPPSDEKPIVKAPQSEKPAIPAPVRDQPAPRPAPAPTPASPPPPTASGGDGAGAQSGTSSDRRPGGSTGGSSTRRGSTALDLDPDAASTFDPLGRGGDDLGDPADALDGRASTAWEAPVGADGEVGIGLLLSLEKARALSRVAFDALTPGMTVEVYGTRASQPPADLADTRWKQEGTRGDVGVRESVRLDAKYRHVLVWVTFQPADTKAAISEIQLFD